MTNETEARARTLPVPDGARSPRLRFIREYRPNREAMLAAVKFALDRRLPVDADAPAAPAAGGKGERS